tara:strand:+ start:1152 stop:1328 length:177 start_codon:yes stop_codon:yes gene_type:complete
VVGLVVTTGLEPLVQILYFYLSTLLVVVAAVRILTGLVLVEAKALQLVALAAVAAVLD